MSTIPQENNSRFRVVNFEEIELSILSSYKRGQKMPKYVSDFVEEHFSIERAKSPKSEDYFIN